jgi:glycosyltransferase involved in cell wall biosynthesis
MKVLLILTSIEIGTIEKVSYNLYKALSTRKDIELFVVNLKSSEKDFYEFNNLYNIAECKSNNFIIHQFYNFRKVFKLFKIKLKIRPDVSITTQEAGTTINLLSLGSEKKIGIFHAPYYQAKSQGKIKFYLQFLSYKYLYLRLNELYCVSNEIKNSITESFLLIDKSKLKVVYNIHDFDEIKIKSEEQLDEQEEFFFENKVIIYVGRFDENKAPDRLIKAFYELRSNKKIKSDIKLLFIGDGDKDYVVYLNSLVAKYELEQNVFFLGFKQNPYKYIKRSTLLVSSSFSEGLPGVVIESIFLKIPVVTTNSSLGLWEIFNCVKDYNKNLSGIYIAENGILTSNLEEREFIINNISNLGRGIEKFLNDEDFYQKTKNREFKFKYLLDKDYIVNNFVKI